MSLIARRIAMVAQSSNHIYRILVTGLLIADILNKLIRRHRRG